MSPITTHVLDTSRGRPASGVPVVIELRDGKGNWKEVGNGTTNTDGRVPDLLATKSLERGSYRLIFDAAAYFLASGTKGFYSTIPIHFEIEDPTQHYHVPLLLSPFGYSTYRGS